MTKTLKEYLVIHSQRVAENKLPGCKWSNEKWILKLAEEVGELAQTETKDMGEDATREELCDVFHVWCVLANRYGLAERDIVAKFNATSDKKGSKVHL